MKLRTYGWLVAAGALVGCGSGNRAPGEPPDSTGFDASATGDAATDAAPPDAAHVEAGVTSDAASADGGHVEAGSTDAGGEGGVVEAGPPAPDGGTTPALCDPSIAWSNVARVSSIAPAGFDRFGSISQDELTVAWMSAAGTVYVADRASPSAAFGMPAQLDPGTFALATGRVALATGDKTIAGSGLTLIATLTGGTSFVAFVRTAPTGPWGPGSTLDFLNLKGMISEGGGVFAEPVVSVDGASLFYVLTLAGNNPVLYESTWDASNASARGWSSGTPLGNAELAITDPSKLRRATGASADRRTLFFFDEVASTERAAWRSSPTAMFDTFADIAAAPEAAPNASCKTLYFRGMDTNGAGLFTDSTP